MSSSLPRRIRLFFIMNRQERRRLAKANAGNDAELLAQAFRQHRQGQFAAAETLYRQVLQHEPGHLDATRLLGDVMLDRGRATDGIAILKQLVSQHPRYSPGHFSLSNAYRLTGQIDAAITSYRDTISLNPGFAEAHHGLGLALLQAARA